MAEGNFSVVRVDKITASGAQKVERHNERKNESYGNMNVDTARIPLNVHYKDTGGLTYNELFQKLIDEGRISTRGQKEFEDFGGTILEVWSYDPSRLSKDGREDDISLLLSLDSELDERIQMGPDITRVLYFFVIGGKAVLTNGFVKKTQKTPRKEFVLAKKYRYDYEMRKEHWHGQEL